MSSSVSHVAGIEALALVEGVVTVVEPQWHLFDNNTASCGFYWHRRVGTLSTVHGCVRESLGGRWKVSGMDAAKLAFLLA